MAGSVNLRFARGAIGNIESYVQCLYGYDIRTEVVGSKGSILIGSIRQNSATLQAERWQLRVRRSFPVAFSRGLRG